MFLIGFLRVGLVCVAWSDVGWMIGRPGAFDFESAFGLSVYGRERHLRFPAFESKNDSRMGHGALLTHEWKNL